MDAGIAAIVVALFLLMPLTLYFLVYAFDDDVECPGCSTKICSSRFKSGKACPTCGHTTDNNSEPHSTTTALNQECPRCSVGLATRHAIQLWDGKAYCRTCVGDASELLLAKATECHQYQEIIRPSFRYFLFSRHVAVAIRDGILMSQNDTSIDDVALKDCVWFETQNARIWANNYGAKRKKHNYIVMHGPAIVIRTPSTWYRVHTGQLAVGFSAESYEIWKSLLTIAGLPKMPNETNTLWHFYEDACTKAFYDQLAKLEHERV